jgi:predicted CXXCH cytochrome family protein
VRHDKTGRKSGGLFAPVLIFAVIGFSLVMGHASTNDQKWLRFFFDGVPSQSSVRKHSSAGSTNKNHSATAPAPAVPRGPVMFVHQPFGEGKCTECHGDGGMSPQPKMPALKLCFSCHKDFITGFKVKHQPVENGDCTSCHTPHQSPNKFLLVKKGNELCLTCHDSPLGEGKFKHQAVESGDCLDCHAPHATNFKGLLKKSVKDTCMDCHDDVANKKDVHLPVGNGDCTACHASHASDNKHLLIKSGEALCWECHDNFLEKAKFTHDVVDDCTLCHDPHQSNAPGLLKKEGNAMCFDCHDDSDIKAVKAHLGAEGKSCLLCHDPHVGHDKNLLKPAAKNLVVPR